MSASAESTASVAAETSKKIALMGTYILTSAALIRFNKHMMKEDVFPYSVALTFLHMGVSLFACLMLYALRPSLFPGMAAAAGQRATLLRWFVPIGAVFALSLYTSNKAYIYCNVAFLQFMKENNVLITFMLSCLIGLQCIDRLKFAIIVWVVACSAFSVGAELHFVWIGFLLQALSQIAECSRAVLGECVLTGANLKLDPLTYTLFSAPTTLAVLAVSLAGSWEPQILTQAASYWYLLVPNAMLAFILNLLVATIIKEFSAVGFTMGGLLKDIFIVVVSAWAFGEVVTFNQLLGFMGSIIGIACWSYVKMNPMSQSVLLAERLLGLDRGSQPEEQLKLLAKVQGYGMGRAFVPARSGTSEAV